LQHRQIAGIACQVPWYRLSWETDYGHHGESHGYGNNPRGRADRQPSPNQAVMLVRMQFTD
jgi:hypothetical protein